MFSLDVVQLWVLVAVGGNPVWEFLTLLLVNLVSLFSIFACILIFFFLFFSCFFLLKEVDEVRVLNWFCGGNSIQWLV